MGSHRIGIIFWLLVLSFFLCVVPPGRSFAYQQNDGVCYSQCAAYKFVWRGEACYDLFANQCTSDEGNTIVKTIQFLKSVYDVVKSGEGVDTAFKAWFVCKPLIESCIAPELTNCHNTCALEPNYYAPNLSVGSNWGSVDYRGIYYDDTNHTLVFKVVNNGLGYASDIDVSASWGHTKNRDLIVSGGGMLFTEKIPELLFLGARVGAPKTPGDYVTDFLIEESNFAKYLQGFKSDANNHYVPPAWYKTIPFTAPPDEYTKVIVNVDPNQMIPESNEGDNTFILEINDLPTPANFNIDTLTTRRTNPASLTEYMVSFAVHNTGEENGEARVKWYEGDYVAGKNPLFEQNMVVQAKDKVLFDHMLMVDVSKGGDSCNSSKEYTLVIFDKDGAKHTERKFTLPLYAGSINGRVEDLFGKKVVGATVTASSGQSAVVNDMGYYHIGGIATLGKVTITATHPDFSQPISKEVEIKFDDSHDTCHVDGLSHGGVNFILKDQDVMFTIEVKDTTGASVNAHVLAANLDWRLDQDVSGETPLPGLQPGKYVFTISAPGYKTISQDVNAVPNDQGLEFTLEKLNGRPDDSGLTIHKPNLLWQMERGAEIVSQITATKDGKEVMVYTTGNKANTGKLYFLEALTGKKIKVVSPTIATGGQSQACLDTSYDGNTTALYVHDGGFGMAQKTRNVIKLFTNRGSEFGTKDWQSGGGVHGCDVSPDGFYIHPERLINKGLYVYTRHDIEGIKDDETPQSYPTDDALHFTTADTIVAGCPREGGQCVQTIYKNVIATLGRLTAPPREIDSSQDASHIAIATTEKAYLFTAGTQTWEKNIKVYGDLPSISVSPGGEYVIYSSASPTDHNRSLKIFTNNNLDKTPPNTTNPGKEDVIFVHANDKGIFFATQQQKTIKYYQIGTYSTDYNPATVSPTPAPLYTNNISYYENGAWQPLDRVQYDELLPNTIYMANSTVNVNMNDPYGSLHILGGTLFGVDQNHHPILLKGQMTMDFTSPEIMYAIKFDRYDISLFQTKLNQLTAGILPASDYFVVKNIHTKYLVSSTANLITVAVTKGEVSVTSDTVNQTVRAQKQIAIDAKGHVKESAYIGWNIYKTIGVVALLVCGILLVIKKATIAHKVISPDKKKKRP